MKVLFIAPHADDETLGAGGTIARNVANGHDVTVAVLTGPGEGKHPVIPNETWDVVREECRQAMKVLGVNDLIFENIPAALVSDIPLHELHAVVSQLINTVKPGVLFLPFLNDLHRDHREIFHALSVCWRPCSKTGRGIKEIYCYETVSETHWNFPYVEAGFLPNCWFDISDYVDKKIEAMSCYKSQIRPAPDSRSLEALRALATWRGSQMNMPAAEAFVLVRKLS